VESEKNEKLGVLLRKPAGKILKKRAESLAQGPAPAGKISTTQRRSRWARGPRAGENDGGRRRIPVRVSGKNGTTAKPGRGNGETEWAERGQAAGAESGAGNPHAEVELSGKTNRTRKTGSQRACLRDRAAAAKRKSSAHSWRS
jgi:hypothetical protein